MKTKPVLGLALVPLVVALLAPPPPRQTAPPPAPLALDIGSQPESPAPMARRAWSHEPRIDRAAPAVQGVASMNAREAATTERPRWPDDWPSLDPVTGSMASATQTMASGEIDVYLDGNSTFEISDDPTGGGQPVDDGDEQDVHIATNSSYVPADFHDEDADDGPETYGDPTADAVHITDGERASKWVDFNEDGEDERGVGPSEEPVPDRGDPFDMPLDPTDTPPDEPMDTGDPDSDEDERGTPTEPPSEEPPSAPATGYRITTPDGQPVDAVILSQEFVIELRVKPDEAASASGRDENGDEYVDVTLRSEEGDEETVRLYRVDEPSEDGLVRYVTREPVSIAGHWGGTFHTSSGTYYPGTIEGLDIDMGSTDGEQIVRLTVNGVTGGFSTLRLYGDKVLAGIAEIEEALDFLEQHVRLHKELADGTRATNRQGQTELDMWRRKIDSQLGVIAEARRRLAGEQLPIFKFRYGKAFLDYLAVRGPNGLEIRDQVFNSTDLFWATTIETIDKDRRGSYSRPGGFGVPQAVMDVVSAYTVGMYSTFAHVTMIGPLLQAITGRNEFNQEASRGAALVELATGATVIILSAGLINAMTNGNLLPSVEISFVTGRGNVTTVGPRLGGPRDLSALTGRGQNTGAVYPGPLRPTPRARPTPQPGRTLGGDTQGGAAAYPGAPRATPTNRPAREPGRTLGDDTAGGVLPAPGRGGRGLSTEAARFARERGVGDAVAEARRRGVPDEVIEGVLTEARNLGDDAARFVTGRLEIETAIRNNEPIFVSPDDVIALQRGEVRYKTDPETGRRVPDDGLDAPPAIPYATREQLLQMRTVDVRTVETIIQKANLEAQGKPQTWTPDEIRHAEALARRLDNGEDLSTWKTAEVQSVENTGFDGRMELDALGYDGLKPMFTQGDLDAIRAVWGGGRRPPGAAPSSGGAAPGAPPSGRPTGAPTAPACPAGGAGGGGGCIQRITTQPAGKRWGHLGDATVDEAFGRPGLSDDTWVHFGGSEIAEGVAQKGVMGHGNRSYWLRWGEVKNMTQGDLRWKIGESATSGLSDLRTMVIAPETVPIRTVPGNYGLKVEGVIDGPVTGGRIIVAPADGAPGAVRPAVTTPQMPQMQTGADVRPLSSLDQYRNLVNRQSAGETIDLSTIARPGIARVADEGIIVAQGAGRWERARPDEWIDVFVPADAKLPNGISVQILERNVPTELVRQANLLSSRGTQGANPSVVDLSVRNVTSWNRIRVRAGDVQAPTSVVRGRIDMELDGLREQGVNVDALEKALRPLSPADQLQVILDPAARTRAIETGVATPPPSTPAPRVVNPVIDPTALGGPSGQGGTRSPIEVVFRSLGGSQGAVMEAFFVNWGEDDVHIDAEAVTFEPVDELDPDAQARYEELMKAFTTGKPAQPPPIVVGLRAGPAPLPPEWQGANAVRVVIDAYCLDFAAGVPTEGMIFRIADREKQEANDRFHAIIAASGRLRDAGALNPDTDPDAYFHSIRQWAIWVEERDLDREGYEEAIVEHTRKNFEAAGRRWTREAEQLVRRLVPNRWRDITEILAQAERLERAA